jgi:hypothetical protein
MSTVYIHKVKKEVYKLNIPVELIHEVISYCSWKRPKISCMWYIVASKLDPSCLIRARQIDLAKEYLASDDDMDGCFVFKHMKDEVVDYVKHIENNRTV